MSEPTYRVDLSYHAEERRHIAWRAEVVRLSDKETLTVRHAGNREEAFARALRWVAIYASAPKHSSSVYLSEDGDLLDSAEVFVCNPDESGGLR